jgi:hypothetical protein
MSKDQLDKAESFLKEAQGICTDSQDKGEVLLHLGTLTSKKGNKSGARELYRQAASINATVAKEAYERLATFTTIAQLNAAKK